MSNLYEITNGLARTIDIIMENGGEVTDETERLLDEGQASLKAKGIGIVHYYLNLDGDVDTIDKEMARLQMLKKGKVARSDWAKGYLKDNMERTRTTKIEAPTFTLTIAKNPPSVEVYNEEEIPEEYVEIRSTTYVDKKTILRDLKAGKEVSGARLVTGKTNLRVK